MKKLKPGIVLMIAVLCFLLSGCGAASNAASLSQNSAAAELPQASSSSEAEELPPSSSSGEGEELPPSAFSGEVEELPPSAFSSEEEELPAPSSPGQTQEVSASSIAQAQQATLYIGDDGSFAEYPFAYEGELTPEVLIMGISQLTGWDLTLADEVTTGKGGMTVCFARTSALFVGPPNPQKEQFHVFDAEQLAQMILDSIQKTLQMNFTGEGGNPDELDIYYCMEGDQPLELSNIERSWPLDQPYEW